MGDYQGCSYYELQFSVAYYIRSAESLECRFLIALACYYSIISRPTGRQALYKISDS
jgi:hypothetical protein